MITAELKEFIDRIKSDLSFIKECNNSMTDRSFGCEDGVLISGNEAECLVSLLSNLTEPLHPSISHINADPHVKQETIEALNRLAKVAYKTVIKKEEESSHPTLPSDAEIEAYVVEQPIKEMSIEYRRNLMANGAKWMRSIASARIAEMEIDVTLSELKDLLFEIQQLIAGWNATEAEWTEWDQNVKNKILRFQYAIENKKSVMLNN